MIITVGYRLGEDDGNYVNLIINDNSGNVNAKEQDVVSYDS